MRLLTQAWSSCDILCLSKQKNTLGVGLDDRVRALVVKAVQIKTEPRLPRFDRSCGARSLLAAAETYDRSTDVLSFFREAVFDCRVG
jgi:hypothetical protein